MIDLKTLLKLDPDLKWQSGPQDVTVSKVVLPESAAPNRLAFALSAEAFQKAIEQGASLVIVPDSSQFGPAPGTICLVRTPNPKKTMARLLPRFDDKLSRFPEGRHPTAAIAPNAQLSPSARIGAFAVIGENVHIGDNTIIGAHTVVERDSRIGANTILHPQVFVGARSLIGQRCEIHPHVTLGSDGFGFATDQKFNHQKIPQLGHVEIEDDVEIGANCAIDRGTLGATILRQGAKLDNLCHIAHNVEVGANSLLAAGFMVAGSSKIGARNMYGGSVVVTDHVSTADDVIVGGRSSVTNDIKKAGRYGGYPLQPLRAYLRNLALLTHLVDIRKDLQRALKALNLAPSNKETDDAI